MKFIQFRIGDVVQMKSSIPAVLPNGRSFSWAAICVSNAVAAAASF